MYRRPVWVGAGNGPRWGKGLRMSWCSGRRKTLSFLRRSGVSGDFVQFCGSGLGGGMDVSGVAPDGRDWVGGSL